MILAHKIALDPNEEQAVYLARAAGTARFAWNWALARWQQEYALWREYRCGPKPSEASLRRELNALKADAFPWMTLCKPASLGIHAEVRALEGQRDHNASINLANMAASSAATACGAGSSGLDLAIKMKLPAVKQEPTHETFVHV